jgi:hypothetical protein
MVWGFRDFLLQMSSFLCRLPAFWKVKKGQHKERKGQGVVSRDLGGEAKGKLATRQRLMEKAARLYLHF